MSKKRGPTSPAEKQPKKFNMPAKKTINPTVEGTKVIIEVFGLNENEHFGTLSESELKYIWEKQLGRGIDEVFGMSQKRSLTRHFRATFTLNIVLQPQEVHPSDCLVFRRRTPNGSEDDYDSVHCRIMVINKPGPAEIGQNVKITAKTNDFSVTPDEIGKWLIKFGQIGSSYDYVKNSIGIRTDTLEVDLVLRKHVPEFLPIAGKKVQIDYPGIPRACIRCYKIGHLKRNCKSPKVEWIDRVAELRKSGEFPDELFGDWLKILDQ